MASFLDGWLAVNCEPLHLGETELAIIEQTLTAISHEKSLLIHNPFPSDSIPLVVCTAFMWDNSPSFQWNRGRPGNKSLLLFPNAGYVGDLDVVNYEHVLNPNKRNSLFTRIPLEKLSNIGSNVQLYTAKDSIDLDDSRPVGHCGAIFIDLRKPRWKNRIGELLSMFISRSKKVPLIIYTDKMDGAAEFAADQVDKRIDITSELLSTANTRECVKEASDITTQEYIHANLEIDVWNVSVADKLWNENLIDFLDLKSNLQEQDLAYVEVGQLFNLLTKTPFAPKYWDSAIAEHGFFDTIDDLIDRIESLARHKGGMDEEKMLAYCQQANEFAGHLDESHALQNTVFSLISEVAKQSKPMTFVLKNKGHKMAFKLAYTTEQGDLPDNITLIHRKELTPDPDGHVVFLYPPFNGELVYQFPPAPRLGFIQYSVWTNSVKRSWDEARRVLNVQEFTQRNVGGPDSIRNEVINLDDLDESIEGYLQNQVEQEVERQRSATIGEGPSIALGLDNGEVRRMGEYAHVSVFSRGGSQISRKQARNVEPGEEMVLIDEAVGDMYDLLLTNAKQQEKAERYGQLVERWRQFLDEGISKQGLSEWGVVDRIQKMGSSIKSQAAISRWRTGSTIGPDDPEDVKRILRLFAPEFEPLWKTFVEAIEYIRQLHTTIGKQIRGVLEAELNPTTTSNIRDYIDDDTFTRITQNITITKVIEVTYEN